MPSTTARAASAAISASKASGRGLDADGMIACPYPAPTQPLAAVHWALDLNSNHALTQGLADVYRNALVIYQALVERWFPTLAPTLGLACVLLAGVSGVVTRGQAP